MIEIDKYLAKYSLGAKVNQVLLAIFYSGAKVGKFVPIGLKDKLIPVTGLDQKKISGALKILREKK